MPINGMNVGRDYTFGYYDSNTGQMVDFGDIQSVSITADYTDVVSRPYNGPPRFGYIPNGFSISFTITRTGKDLEEFQLLAAQRFDEGQIDRPGYLSETVTNQDGTVSRYQYTGFVFKLTNLGEISRDTVIRQSGVGKASKKVKIP
ncbi:hypothetical protein LG047_15350 [Methylocystis sp. WRRC1]|uniref:hypothetical protein n=1 Tax=Methylocystis sp. WRRC1 TaxID=1732014 RepID=UPI001D149CC4|nr:hypothetical protein [Methylocystis sp. WRRC1]MCC3246676.1 hypothetical protein [Methylocystis sp. WRRC1]